MVIGYNPSHSTASIEVNAPLKILCTLIRCLKNEILQEVVREKNTAIAGLDIDEYQNNDDYDNNAIDELPDNTQGTQEDQDNTGPTDKIDVGEFKDFKDLEAEEKMEFQSNLEFLV